MLISTHPDPAAEAVCAADMALEAQYGPEPWTQADEDAAERRDHYVDSTRHYGREFRL